MQGWSVADSLVRGYIRHYIDLGWSGNKIWNTLPVLGLPKFHRQSFQAVVRMERARKSWQEDFLGLDPFLPTSNKYMFEKDLVQPYRYQVIARKTLINPATGQTIQTNVTLYDDYNLGLEGWKNDWLDKFGKYWGERGFELAGFNLVEVWHNKGAPW